MFPTEAHYHTVDSPCLVRLTSVPTDNYIRGERLFVPTEHWWRCTYLTVPLRPPQCGQPYIVHEHGGRFEAHEPRDRCEWPA
jgi:hypothetical protein